jgi:hypothetical protein
MFLSEMMFIKFIKVRVSVSVVQMKLAIYRLHLFNMALHVLNIPVV